jgi:hypothetical protein
LVRAVTEGTTVAINSIRQATAKHVKKDNAMSHRQPSQTSGQVHQSVAVRELIDHDSDYDTSTTAWVAFDRRMTKQLDDLERRLAHYFTPVAVRKGLGR